MNVSLPMSTNNDCFISYRRTSSVHLARNIFTELNRRNINAFLDVEGIDATQFDTFILNQIASRPHFIVLLSQGSLARCVNEADWLLREIQHAYDLKRNIIPVYDAGFDWNKERHYLPEHLQEFLPLQNAVSFTHEYYHAFIDKIMRFIRNPQQKAPVEVKLVPKQEAEKAKQMIQKALEVRFDDVTVIEWIGKYHELSTVAETSTDWKDLLNLWSQIRSSGNIPDIFEMDDEEAHARQALEQVLKREEEIRKQEEVANQHNQYLQVREREYDFIRQLYQAGQVPHERILKTLEKFWEKYTFYDPEHIAQTILNIIFGQADYYDVVPRIINYTSGDITSTQGVQWVIGDLFEWCEVPAGKFLYGGKEEKLPEPGFFTRLFGNRSQPSNEVKQKPVKLVDMQELTLPSFSISKYPITYRQFQIFIDAKDGFTDPRWWEGLAQDQSQSPGEQNWKIDDHPRENVSWYDAMAFCRWLSFRLGGNYDIDHVNEWLVRLPTEFEWEKAARGTDGRAYPYGNTFDENKSNTRESGIRKTTPVTQYPKGESPYGVFDLSGNVWEWCLTEYSNPQVNVGQENLRSEARRLRGGSWNYSDNFARAVSRVIRDPGFRYSSFGFRVVCVRKGR
jgi:formylglycine-generating enzyme required for sulfatase activity